MINHIELKNFKAFQHAAIDLSNLNLFTGVNGMGKSSFIQALLLLRQSDLDRQLPEQIVLNHDKYIKLGKSQDVLNIYASEDEDTLNIHLRTTSEPHVYVEIKPLQNKTSLQVNDNYLPDFWQGVKSEALFNDNFQYLYAEREAPKETAQLDQYAVEVLRSLGRQGQHTAHFIAKYQAESVKLPSLVDPNAAIDTLASQIEFWLSKITKGVRLNSDLYEDLGIARLSYQFADGDDLTPKFSPLNVGFGFTYVLPVITALLSAQSGDLIIIENPESHLHPSGQVQIGMMLALAAQDGVQLIIETHSDHVLNGIRVATKHYHEAAENDRIGKGIDCEKVKIFFFERQTPQHNTQIVPIKVNKKGRLSQWPKAFFDEWSNMLDELMD
jgi:predicted ATPase